jgi:hypothetical protein
MAVTGRTNGTLICTSQGDTITGRVVVESISYKECTAANATCKVGTGTGYAVVMYRAKSDASNMIDTKYLMQMYDGLKVLSLPSGIVEIQLM